MTTVDGGPGSGCRGGGSGGGSGTRRLTDGRDGVGGSDDSGPGGDGDCDLSLSLSCDDPSLSGDASLTTCDSVTDAMDQRAHHGTNGCSSVRCQQLQRLRVGPGSCCTASTDHCDLYRRFSSVPDGRLT